MHSTIHGNLEAALNALVQRTWGTNQNIASSQRISQRSAIVTRLSRLATSSPPSIIAKHVFDAEFPLSEHPHANPEFREELLAHVFLRQLDAEEGLKPQLLGYDASGIVLLQDLGTDNYSQMRTFDELVPMLARGFARLHTRTQPHMRIYHSLRMDFGMCSAETESRRYGTAMQKARFRAGAAYALRRASAEQRSAMEFGLNRIQEQIEFPGKLECLIHDDMANARQTFEFCGDLLLLDFEYSKPGHPLLDLVKPIIGKFEVNVADGMYHWVCPRFELDLARAYRRECEAITDESISEERWQEGLLSALVYGTCALAGRALEFAPDTPIVGSIEPNINGIFHRLQQLSAHLRAPSWLSDVGLMEELMTPSWR